MLRNILDVLEWKKETTTINLWFVRAYSLVNKMHKHTKAKHTLQRYILTASVNQVTEKNAGKKTVYGRCLETNDQPAKRTLEPFSRSESRDIFEKWNKCIIWKIMENCQCSLRRYTILLDQQQIIINIIWYHQGELTLQCRINWNWEKQEIGISG